MHRGWGYHGIPALSLRELETERSSIPHQCPQCPEAFNGSVQERDSRCRKRVIPNICPLTKPTAIRTQMKSNDESFLILLLAFLFRSQLPFQFLLGRTCCKALSPNSLCSTWVSSPTTGLLAACCCIQPTSHAWCLGEVWSTARCRKHPRASSWLSPRRSLLPQQSTWCLLHHL